jgi:hypothetical protein
MLLLVVAAAVLAARPSMRRRPDASPGRDRA